MIKSPLATAATRPHREYLRRTRRQALRRSLAIGALWGIAILCVGWLLLAGIAGFAHA